MVPSRAREHGAALPAGRCCKDTGCPHRCRQPEGRNEIGLFGEYDLPAKALVLRTQGAEADPAGPTASPGVLPVPGQVVVAGPALVASQPDFRPSESSASLFVMFYSGRYDRRRIGKSLFSPSGAPAQPVVAARYRYAKKRPVKMTTSCRKCINHAQNMPCVSWIDLASSQPRNPARNTPAIPPGVPK